MTSLAYYLLALLWATPHWRRIMKFWNWLINLWRNRPISRWQLDHTHVKPGMVVRLADNPALLTVKSVAPDKLAIEEPEVQHAIVHTGVVHNVPWWSFRQQALEVDGRRVLAW